MYNIKPRPSHYIVHRIEDPKPCPHPYYLNAPVPIVSSRQTRRNAKGIVWLAGGMWHAVPFRDEAGQYRCEASVVRLV